MFRRFTIPILALVVVALTCGDALACGDKFLRVGRSARFRAYASIHPSSILVYAPRWTRGGIADFERMLKRAGHKPVTVTTASAMSHAFAAEKYDVVITSYSDTGAVKNEVDALASRPALLPLLYKATNREAAEVRAAYCCVLNPSKMTPFQALEEIDRLIDLRLKDTTTSPATR
jgi:hypothetical protein